VRKAAGEYVADDGAPTPEPPVRPLEVGEAGQEIGVHAPTTTIGVRVIAKGHGSGGALNRVVVIGGGIAGASAARTLARRGSEVVLVERGPSLGGLVVSFEIAGTPLECFYHYVVPGEEDIQALIADFGLGHRLEWFTSTVGMLLDGRIWPFTSPLDLLRFRPLSFPSRVRTGLGNLRLARVRDWKSLDGVAAADWLEELTGSEARRVVWEPLLRTKFGSAASTVPAAWMWRRLQQRQEARRFGAERLGYLRGGFRQLFDALEAELTRLRVRLVLDSSVDRILLSDGRAAGVTVDGQDVEADAVLYTGNLASLPSLVPPAVGDKRWSEAGQLGVVCVVVELVRPLSPVYWTNVCDGALPFGGIIEHTNLVPADDYGGRHVVYLSRYFTEHDPIAGARATDTARTWIAALEDHFSLATSDVLGVHPFKTNFAAPLVTTGHLARIPPVRAHVPGLYVSTTAQIYPQDRGMSEGVRTARDAATTLLNDLGVPEVV
jgi:protoporphyrinogen oxidase